MAVPPTLQCLFSVKQDILLDSHRTAIKARKRPLLHHHHLTLRLHSTFPIVPILSCKGEESSSEHTLCLVKPFQFFSALHCQDLDIFKDSKPVIWQNVPQSGFVCVFVILRFKLCIFGRKIIEMMLCSSCCMPSGGTFCLCHC